MPNFLPTARAYPLLLGLALLGCLADSAAQTTRPSAKGTGKPTAALKTVANALPYTLEFVEKTYGSTKPLPRLQSYAIATSSAGEWLVAGGRRQGLHTFEPAPATNFVRDSANHFLFVINPATGQYWSFDVNRLPPGLAAPLQATNLQQYNEPATGQCYLVGGYGWKADRSDMTTFGTLMRFKVDDLVVAIKTGQSPATVAALIENVPDNRLAVTGGELFRMNGTFYLVFGQNFTGQYRAFGGSDFHQQYTEEVRAFTLQPNSLSILSYGATPGTGPDQPFHRRDGNIIADIDPATGQPRITAFGGVFMPGIIGAYTYPIYITSPATPTIDRTVSQKFSQYNCPVISVYDGTKTKAVYHTFFGGIGHYYYNQTAAQKAVYDQATQQGRNDGFPFVADITTLVESANGTYKEFIHPTPTPGNRLVGSSIPFVLNPSARQYAYTNEVLDLALIPPKTRLLIGYIYGGVEAQNPLPAIPNTGTFVSNSVFEVYLTYKPFAAIPASQGHQSTKRDQNLHRE